MVLSVGAAEVHTLEYSDIDTNHKQVISHRTCHYDWHLAVQPFNLTRKSAWNLTLDGPLNTERETGSKWPIKVRSPVKGKNG